MRCQSGAWGSSRSRESTIARGTSIDATFARFDHALAADLTAATIIPTLDTCSTSGDSDVLGSRGLAPGFLAGHYTTTDFELVGAGEAITFTAPAGTWLTLSRDQGTDDSGYVTSAPPPPAGLVLDVPGDGFPAFPNMPVADVKSLGVVTPDGLALLAPDYVIRWTSGTGDLGIYVIVEIRAPAIAPDESVDENAISFYCFARDDGELELRAAANDELRSLIDAGANMKRIVAGRFGVTARQTDDALLVIVNSVRENVPER